MSKDLRETAIESILENSEAIIDIVTDDELLAAIPVVGTAVKACKAIDSIRERAFAAKLISFLKGTGPARAETVEKWRTKLIKSPDEARKIGQTLFFSIERINDLDKADIIALLFLDYIDGGTTSETYLRFLHAIDSAGVSDMHEFISRKDLPEDFKEE